MLIKGTNPNIIKALSAVVKGEMYFYFLVNLSSMNKTWLVDCNQRGV